MWFEPLPDQCPPNDAFEPNGMYFRLADGEKPTCSDFWSHRKIWPTKSFHTTECIAMAVSVFSDAAPLSALKKMPLHASKSIVAVHLLPDSGRVKQTGANTHHHSWWRALDFEVIKSVQQVSV